MPRQDTISKTKELSTTLLAICFAILSSSFLFPDPYPAAQGNLEQEVSCWLKGVGQRKEEEQGGVVTADGCAHHPMMKKEYAFSLEVCLRVRHRRA